MKANRRTNRKVMISAGRIDHVTDIPPRPTIRGMAGGLRMSTATTITDIPGMATMVGMAEDSAVRI